MPGEFRVNSYQNNWQRDAHITTFADGGFLVVYESYINNYDDTPSATVVMAQRYDANGLPVGGERILDGIDGAKSDDARVTTLSDGGFVVAWSYDDYDDILTLEEKVYVRAYNADGSPRTGVIRVDTVASNDAVAPEVFATANGGFNVVFGTDRSETLFDQIYMQRFAADGTRIGGNALVNTVSGQFDEIYARSATLTNGTSITIWNSEGGIDNPGGFSTNQVRGMLTNAAGAVVRGDFGLAINYGSPGGGSGAGYDVTALQNGGFVVTNINYDFNLGLDTEEASYYIMMRFFDASGQQTGPARVVTASDDLASSTRVAQLATGEIVVVWDQDDPEPGVIGDSVYGRMFSANGQALSGAFEIGVDRFNYDDQVSPEVAALAGGGFVVTYDSDSIDSDNEGVAATIFGRGTAADDLLRVDVTGHLVGLSGNDQLIGDRRGNLIDGGTGNDTLHGGDGSDRLLGRIGADTFVSGNGNDILFGGVGPDRFIFNTTPNDATNRDAIRDFTSGQDRIILENAIYTALGPAGFLAAEMFKVVGSGGVVDPTDRIIYNAQTGNLFYDPDGSGAAGAVNFANLNGAPGITVWDFLIS